MNQRSKRTNGLALLERLFHHLNGTLDPETKTVFICQQDLHFLTTLIKFASYVPSASTPSLANDEWKRNSFSALPIFKRNPFSTTIRRIYRCVFRLCYF